MNVTAIAVVFLAVAIIVAMWLYSREQERKRLASRSPAQVLFGELGDVVGSIGGFL
jgi:hypothetical protein